jgi:iron complex outermembrane recepter protein
MKYHHLKSALLGGISVLALTAGASAREFDIPAGDLKSALDSYARQSGLALLVSDEAIRGAHSRGVKGDLSADEALSHILADTGFVTYRHSRGVIGIVRETVGADQPVRVEGTQADPIRVAAASSSVETVVVTSSKIKGDIQTVPIAITALSQEQLTERQIAGGPDLVKEVPNLTFTKTNFTGYSIEIRGIGTQAISVTTDPAVAVAFNDTPFLRNHFFEQEFYDVAQVEVLRGPQGTLYGRNATAGVVNVVSAVPSDQFEAMASADWGNYHNRRYEGMINIPIVGDKLAIRLAGEWTKRDGYSFNTLTNQPIDGRDLWSTRATLRWKPVEGVTADLIWEHFAESDDRLRSSKQLCKRDNGPDSILGQTTHVGSDQQMGVEFLGQGCVPTSMYSPDAFGVPNALSLPYYGGFIGAGFGLAIGNPLNSGFEGPHRDPYASTTQSTNLRDIESTLNPKYIAKNDTVEFNAEWQVEPSLTLNSATGYNDDFLWSTEDFNRFNTQPGIFSATNLYGSGPPDFPLVTPDGNYSCRDGYLAIGEDCIAAGHYDPNAIHPAGTPTGYFCDPQLGCSNRLVGEDLSDEHSWQLSQELRLTSNFQGPLNFSAGGNYLHYETEENYYVFFNTLTMWAANDGLNGRHHPWIPFQSTNEQCVPYGHQYADPNVPTSVEDCAGYIDPHPLSALDNGGHNYFLSQNPYTLNSYAMFGEVYYDLTKDVKLTGGLRWTDDKKHFIEIPSELLTRGYGYPTTGNLDQEWKEWTGRAVINWTPKLDFTDQSMFYASYAHGYKAGGANPPSAVLLEYASTLGDITNPTHPRTFAPEFNDAFELGTKNTAADGSLTLNGNVFFYNYKAYQISYIVDRSAVNLNFDATVKGAELQATWEPLPGLKLAFAGGYEDTRITNGQKAIDLMDRTAGNPNWHLVKPFPSQASNCVLPDYVISYLLANDTFTLTFACGLAYANHEDPVTRTTYSPTTSINGYTGFDPLAGNDPSDPYTGQNIFNGIDYGPAPNNGAGFYKNVGGKQLPNAPHYTVSLTADYTMPVSADWAATFHSDFYWQSQSWARVFNAVNDKIRGYSSTNVALILTDASGWQVMGYVKNIFNKTAITGTFLNSDDTGLTTNVFLTDPRLYGVRVTKHFDGPDSGFSLFSGADGKKPEVWLTLGGNFARLQDDWTKFRPDFIPLLANGLPNPMKAEKAPDLGLDWEGKLTYQPEDSDWVLKAGIRYGRTSRKQVIHKSVPPETAQNIQLPPAFAGYFGLPTTFSCQYWQSNFNHSQVCPLQAQDPEFVDTRTRATEKHTILDFTLGKDVGLGTLGGGVRIAQFSTLARAHLNSDPHYNFPSPANPILNFKYNTKYGNVFDETTNEKRSFHGIGPEITWDANLPVLGNEAAGEVTLDWGLNVAELFGRQTVKIQRTETHKKCPGFNGFAGITCTYLPVSPGNVSRSKNVTVPNLGGYVGLSARYQNAKISLGYRADEFFNAMDGGQDTAKKYDRGFYGPYLNLSIGFGG